MPVILTTAEEIETWMVAAAAEALKLQRPLSDGALRIVARRRITASFGSEPGIKPQSNKRDRYKRHLAHCAVAGESMALWLAANGWAVPYRDCKCATVRDAAELAKSIWSGFFALPWDWRKAQRGIPCASDRCRVLR